MELAVEPTKPRVCLPPAMEQTQGANQEALAGMDMAPMPQRSYPLPQKPIFRENRPVPLPMHHDPPSSYLPVISFHLVVHQIFIQYPVSNSFNLLSLSTLSLSPIFAWNSTPLKITLHISLSPSLQKTTSFSLKKSWGPHNSPTPILSLSSDLTYTCHNLNKPSPPTNIIHPDICGYCGN